MHFFYNQTRGDVNSSKQNKLVFSERTTLTVGAKTPFHLEKSSENLAMADIKLYFPFLDGQIFLSWGKLDFLKSGEIDITER